MSQPNFKSVKVINPDLVFFVFSPHSVSMSAPVYLGFTTLEVSKLIYYSFFYLNVRKLWPTARYLYGDTDSILLSVRGADVEAELGRLTCFDGSNLPKNHPLYSNRSAGRPLFWKMETGGRGRVLSANILRPKLYQLKMYDADGDDDDAGGGDGGGVVTYKNVCRGTPKAYSARFVDDDYEKAILKHESTHTEITSFVRSKCAVYTETSSRLSLSPYDIKMAMTDAVTVHPYGYDPLPP